MTILGARASKLATASLILAATALAAGCATSGTTTVASKKRSKEYFAESEYGVKASPRVTTKRSRLPRGGGREQIGKPYVVRGKLYVPKEDKNYAKVGAASWYGDAFHGRLTANGEIYDMTHLTAAHPTMPLPSYARVTNMKNGNSVVVRVNDRGPFAHDRVIDLSRQAAEMLDYTHAGVAQVKVEYVGRAPLDGQDDQYLMASYRPGPGSTVPLPGEGLPTGVMVAMAGSTPSAGAPAAAPFPGQMTDVGASGPADSTDVALPEAGPVVPERPLDAPELAAARPAVLSYADSRVSTASAAFAAFDKGASAHATVDVEPAGYPYVAVGTYSDRRDAEAMASRLRTFGPTSVETARGAFAVTLSVDASGPMLDEALRAAWDAGASDAMIVRE